jgi:hypothetical protein
MKNLILAPFRLPVHLLLVLNTALLAVIVFLLAGGADRALADTETSHPPTLHYQGRLLDPASGQPKADGTYTMLFTIYNQASGGTPQWSEAKSVTASKGIFSARLGETSTLSTSLFNGQDLWLGMAVGGDPEMTPRQPLLYVPYAVYAQNAKNLNGQPASAFAASTHTHPTLPLGYGTVQSNGTLSSGAHNISNVTWNASLLRYEITFGGSYAYGLSDITVATLTGDVGSCPAGATIRQSTVDSKLLVYVVNSAGTKIQCPFRFVSHSRIP